MVLPYRLFGDLCLKTPKYIFLRLKLTRLREMEPHLRELEARVNLAQGQRASAGVPCIQCQG